MLSPEAAQKFGISSTALRSLENRVPFEFLMRTCSSAKIRTPVRNSVHSLLVTSVTSLLVQARPPSKQQIHNHSLYSNWFPRQ